MSLVQQLPRSMACAPARRPLRIAVTFSRLPFPMMRGDQLTVAHVLSFLSARGHQVDFRTLNLHGEMTDDQAAWLARVCRQVKIFSHGPVTILSGIIRAMLNGLPLQLGYFSNSKLEDDLARDVGAGKYDIVYSYYLRSGPLTARALCQAPESTRGFLAMQLSQTLNARRIYENEAKGLRKLFYGIESNRLARYEASVWKDFDRAVLIGAVDVAAIKEECQRQGVSEIDNWVYGAHGTDVERFVAADPAEIVGNRLVFSGSMLYQPNIQAVLWFVEHCWPAIRAAMPDAELLIQGRDPVAEIRRLDGRDGIHVTGTVPDVGPVIRSAAVCINPMLSAGGMQNKLIEYMASAKAIVATSVANEGISAPPGTIELADEPQAFAEACIRLLGDRDYAVEMGRRARAHVLEHWTWEGHFRKLEDEFYAALDAAPRRASAEGCRMQQQ